VDNSYFKPVSKELARAYYATFSGPAGQRVLKDILQHCGFLDVTLTDPAHLLLLNFAKQILKNCGVWKENNVQLMLDAIFSSPSQNMNEE
jgi:hypothetical protein